MTTCKRGEVVLIEFRFSEGVGSKKRPALVMSSEGYHKSRHEVIVAAITSNVNRKLFGDTRIEKWEEAGLLYPSVVTGIIRTIKGNMIVRTLGILATYDFKRAQKNIAASLGFC